MTRLLMADTKRLLARRMTWFFPLALMVLAVAGVVIAYFVIDNRDGTPPDFVNDMAGGVDGTALLAPAANLLSMMAFVLGASFVGADIKTGMLEQLLTWEPRRLRIVVSRCIAGAATIAVVSALVATFYVAAVFGLAVVLGTADGTTAELWTNVAVAVGRTGVASGLLAVMGIGATFLVWNSIGSIVGFLTYFFVLDAIVALFLRWVAVWLPVTNATSFASGEDVSSIEGSAFVDDVQIVSHHGYLLAGVVLALWALLFAGVGAARLIQRDID